MAQIITVATIAQAEKIHRNFINSGLVFLSCSFMCFIEPESINIGPPTRNPDSPKLIGAFSSNLSANLSVAVRSFSLSAMNLSRPVSSFGCGRPGVFTSLDFRYSSFILVSPIVQLLLRYRCDFPNDKFFHCIERLFRTGLLGLPSLRQSKERYRLQLHLQFYHHDYL